MQSCTDDSLVMLSIASMKLSDDVIEGNVIYVGVVVVVSNIRQQTYFSQSIAMRGVLLRVMMMVMMLMIHPPLERTNVCGDA